MYGRRSPIQRLQHRLRDEAIPGFVQMDAIRCQNSAGLVVRVVLAEVIDERFAQIDPISGAIEEGPACKVYKA